MAATSPSAVLTPADAVCIPVYVEGRLDPASMSRPNAGAVRARHQKWATGSWPPADGWYGVDTTWREILDAATTVGRDPSTFLRVYPAQAQNELLARTMPLCAYMERMAGSTPAAVVASPIYRFSAERSARGFASYRLGMTMAEWAARRLINLPWTLHVEEVAPLAATPNWFSGRGKRPDLWSTAPGPKPLWLIEAKGAGRLERKSLADGARQLLAVDSTVLRAPHEKVLIASSIEDQLFTMIFYAPSGSCRASSAASPSESADNFGSVAPHVSGASVELSGEAHAYVTARERMLTYWLLRAAQPEELEQVTVVADDDKPRFGETDSETAAARATQSEQRDPRSTREPARDVVTMITAPVAGTGLRLGLSTALLRACSTLDVMMEAIGTELATERSEWAPFAPWARAEQREANSSQQRTQAEREYLAELSGRLWRAGVDAANHAYNADSEDVDLARFLSAPTRQPERSGELEMYTRDTYLAVTQDQGR